MICPLLYIKIMLYIHMFRQYTHIYFFKWESYLTLIWLSLYSEFTHFYLKQPNNALEIKQAGLRIKRQLQEEISMFLNILNILEEKFLPVLWVRIQWFGRASYPKEVCFYEIPKHWCFLWIGSWSSSLLGIHWIFTMEVIVLFLVIYHSF